MTLMWLTTFYIGIISKDKYNKSQFRAPFLSHQSVSCGLVRKVNSKIGRVLPINASKNFIK